MRFTGLTDREKAIALAAGKAFVSALADEVEAGRMTYAQAAAITTKGGKVKWPKRQAEETKE